MEDRGDERPMPLLNNHQEHEEMRRTDPSVEPSSISTKEDEFGMPVREKSEFNKRSLTIVKGVKSRKHAFLRSLIHIPSLVITGGVLTLTFGNVFWKRPSEDLNVILNSLQFAAQFHATLIVASLSAMLLHYVHHQLVSERGVPIGFIGSVFQLGMIEYLFQKEFYSLKIRYVLLFVPASLLIMLTGPASAITMLPRLQFWDVQNLWLGTGDVNIRMYMQGNEMDLFPETLNAANLPPRCFFANASLQSDCPSYGMRHWLLDNSAFSIDSGLPQINKTIEGSWLRYMVGQSSEVNVGIQSVYTTSTLSNFFGNALFAFEDRLREFGRDGKRILGTSGAGTIQFKEEDKLAARYDLVLRAGGKTFPSRKPLVLVECGGHSKEKATLPLPHGQMYIAPWTAAPISSAQWSVSASNYTALQGDLNSTVVNSTWIYNEQFGDVKPSLGAVFFTPETMFPGGCYSCADRNTNFSSYTCTIDARWMATKAFSDASMGRRAIFDSVPNPLGSFSVDGDLKKAAPLTPLYLSESWTKALDVPWIDSITHAVVTNRTVLDTIGQKCLEANTFINATFLGKPFNQNQPHRITKNPMNMLMCLEVWLAVHVTEAISHAQDSVPTYFVAEGHNLGLSDNSKYFATDPYLVQNVYDDIVQLSSNYEPDIYRVKNITKAELEDPKRFTEIQILTSRWGYGYGFQDSTLIYVGVALLLLHAAISIVYIVWILSKGDYRSAGFDSIGGLIALAMTHSGPGVHNEDEYDIKKNWSERVMVRELAADGDHSGSSPNNDQKGNTLVLKRVNIGETKRTIEEA